MESSTSKLVLKSILFDANSSIELSKRISKESLWSLKLLSTTFYVSLIPYGKMKTASYQFTLENMHRMPETKAGWYKYHQKKNMFVIKKGLEAGLARACKNTAIVGFYCLIDGILSQNMTSHEYLSPVVASTATTALLSLQMYKGVRFNVLGLGMGAGLAIGLLQKGYEIIYGQSIKEFKF